MSKKITIILFFVVLLGAGFFGWYIFSQKSVPKNTETENNTQAFPFGSSNTSTGDQNTNNKNEDIGGQEVNFISPNKFFRVSLSQEGAIPVTGATAFTEASTTKIRYIERGTGHIYEISDKKPWRRISNTTIPKIFESFWIDEKTLLSRYNEKNPAEIVTLLEQLPKIIATSSPDQKITTSFFPQAIDSLAIRGNKIFTLSTTAEGKGRGIILDAQGKNPKTIFTSPLHEWQATWPTDTIIALTTKASANLPGYVYFLNPTTSRTSKILGNIAGLTSLTNSDGTAVLYASAGENVLTTSIYTVKTSETALLSIKTLPEKCVWSKIEKTTLYCLVPRFLPNATYPDSWYQGSISFSDTLWKINSTNGQTEILYSPQSSLDGTKPFLDPKEKYLFFTDKTSMILYAYLLK